jgi:hypothetical protein
VSRSRATTAVFASATAVILLAGCHSTAQSGSAAKTSSSGPSSSVAANSAATVSPSPASPAPSRISVTSAPPSVAAATPAADPGTLDVCSLLSAAKASALNKVTYGAATPHHIAAGWDTCTYKNKGAVDPVDIQDLTTQVLSVPGCYAQLQGAEGGGPNVPGVGEAAFGYIIGLTVEFGSNTCVGVSGLTDAELGGDYTPDAAMAKIIDAALK